MKPEEARKWAELYTAIADGKTWQIQSSAGEWNDATNGVHDPICWRVEHLRVKPEPQQRALDAAPPMPTHCLACALRDDAIGQAPNADVTPEYLAWLDTKSQSAGVGGNEAWNAGVAHAQAQIDALKAELQQRALEVMSLDAQNMELAAERDALREFADLMGWTDEMIQREVAITRAILAKEPT